MLGDLLILKSNGKLPDSIVRIRELHSDGCFVDVLLENNTFEPCDNFIDYSELSPIPLTENILKSNGFFEYNPFKTIDYKMYAFPEQCNIKKERGFGIEIGNDSFGITDHCLMPIIYVHELQHALRLCGLSEIANKIIVNKWNTKAYFTE